MSLAKTGQIANCCQPNAIMTLKEYLEDYASPQTKALGEQVIAKELEHIIHPNTRAICQKHLEEIANGQRDFRF